MIRLTGDSARVLEEHDRYDVVETVGHAAEIVAGLDSRGGGR